MLKDIKFQWFKNGIKNIRPDGFISLEQFVNSVINPKSEMLEAFNLIRAAKTKEEKDKLKSERLFFTTPSVIVNPIRNYESITEFLPLAVLEYDNVEYAEELRDYIFEKQPSCIFSYLSPSKRGTKFIFHIQKPTSVEDYKELYFGIAHDLDKFKGFDLCNERPTQPLFCSYDPDAKVRWDAVPSTKRGFKTNAFDVDRYLEFEPCENVSPEDIESSVRMISHMIDKIEDNGHNQVISASTVAGGLSTYYGIDLWPVLEERIKDNDYLSKNTKGYLKTAWTLYNKGLNFPVPLNKKN